jgi:hypothetical protein
MQTTLLGIKDFDDDYDSPDPEIQKLSRETK